MLTFTRAPAVSLQAGGARAEYGHHLLTQRSPSVASSPPSQSRARKPVCSAGRGGSWRIVNSTVVFPEAHLECGGQEART